MDQNEKNEELEIDLGQLFRLLLKKIKLIIASTIMVALIAFVFTYFFVEKKYQSTAKLFVAPKVNEQGTIESSTITSNNNMINNYMEIIKGENNLSKVAEAVGVDNYMTVKNSLSVSNTTNTQFIVVTSKTENAELSKEIVENSINIFLEDMQEILQITNFAISDSPTVNEVAVSPNIKMNTLIGALLGLMASCGYVFLTYLFDKRLRTREEAENFLGIPVLVEIPWFDEE